ncbi:MAG: hypothetical protein M3Y39_16955 [Chloroflexota bacterium]|nr:hypothetical protein [Chloroflexota bacterium]
MTTTEREQLVLSLLTEVTPLIRKSAAAWHLEYEDLRQDAVIHIMDLIDQGVEHIVNIHAYVWLHVRHRLIDKLRYAMYREASSLDVPVGSDCEVTFADLLPSPYYTDPVSVLLSKERLEQLAKTVACLPGTHGIAVRSRYETALATYC